MAFQWFSSKENTPHSRTFWSSIKNWVSEQKPKVQGLWNDLTGQTAVDKQNAANLEMAKYQSQMQEEFYNKYSSPEALMRQYKEAGLNPNLVYGSASAGQSNVPSFNAPHVERSMSGSDKINKALSSISAGLGLVQGIYQAAASREAAQQSAIKTASDLVNYRSNVRRNIFDEDLLGMHVKVSPFRLFGRSQEHPYSFGRSDLYKSYLGAYRESEFNKMAGFAFRNYYDYGGLYDLNGNYRSADYMKVGLSPYMFTRNRDIQLRYQLMNELGNTGTYGKLLLSALGLFMK